MSNNCMQGCNQYRLLGVIKWGYIRLDKINTFKILKSQ